MNEGIENHYRNVVLQYLELRDQLLEALTDEDLGFKPSPRNMTLGQLCVRLGEDQQGYSESFRTLKFGVSFAVPGDRQLTGSVANLKTWFAELD